MKTNLKKILVALLCLMVLLTVSPAFVLAETTESEVTETTDSTTQTTDTTSTTDTTTETPDTDADVEEEAGVTPDSWLYNIERMIETVHLTITPGEEGKAELLIEFANERLAEAQVLSEKDKLDLVEQVMKAYTETVSLANLQVQEIIDEQEAADADTEQTTAETTEETPVITPEETEETAWLNDIIEKIELVQSDADKVVIKLTGYLPESQVEEITQVITAEVQNTIAMKAYVAVKTGFVDAVHDMAAAKKELGQAKSTGDEAAIQAAQDKVEQALQLKKDMQDLRKDVLKLKNEVTKENNEILKEIAKDARKANEAVVDEDQAADETNDEATSEDTNVKAESSAKASSHGNSEGKGKGKN